MTRVPSIYFYATSPSGSNILLPTYIYNYAEALMQNTYLIN